MAFIQLSRETLHIELLHNIIPKRADARLDIIRYDLISENIIFKPNMYTDNNFFLKNHLLNN